MSPLRPAFSYYRQSLALINGVMGDWLHRRGNPLALSMSLSGRPAVAMECRRRICVLVHGLTETSCVWDYPRQRTVDYGSLLAQFEGFSPLYAHYNTGLGLQDNGKLLAENLAELVAEWPVPIEQLVLIGHSMGGLVVRAACENGQATEAEWLKSVTDCVYLGTPHLGAPLARLAGHSARWLRQQELAPLQVIGEILDTRSIGICNLTTGTWTPASPGLVPSIRHFAVSGSLHRLSNGGTDEVPGDALVPRSSARGPVTPDWGLTGEAHFPGVGHFRLAHHSDVYLQIVHWCRRDAS